MRTRHPILNLCLVLALILGSMALGHVRMQPRIAAWAELCIGSEAVTVALDSRGQPIPHDHAICGDCLPAVLAVDRPAETGLRLVAQTPVRLVAWDDAPQPGTRPLARPLPRGPPVTV